MDLVPNNVWGVLTAILRIIAVTYGIVVLLLLLFQERLIFIPSVLDANHKYDFNLRFEQHWIGEKGHLADSLLFRMPKAKGTILFFHGNAGSLAEWGEVASEIASRLSWNVWVIDYPGYGRSEGKISSEEQLHALGRDFLTRARSEFGREEKIIVYGRSIGSGIAVKLAAEHEVAGLILESPYLSLASLARKLFPWAPTFLLRYKMRSDLWINEVKAPVLIVHGDRDEVIPFAQGKSLADLLPSSKFVAVTGGQHNDLSEFDGYWTALSGFLNPM